MIIPKHIAPRTAPANAGVSHAIPFIIHQTFETNDVTENMYNAAARWIDGNPDFEYRFYDKDDRRALIEAHFGSEQLAAYDKIRHGAFKADYWRYCALYLHGGVYADVDMYAQTPLLDLIEPEDHFIAAREPTLRHAVANGFICVTPKHPFIKAAMERATKRTLAQTGNFDGYMITGPGNLGMAINFAQGRNENTVHEIGVNQIDARSSYRLITMLPPLPDRPRCMVDGDTVILLTEYPEYRAELDQFGLKHWLNDPMYNGFIPRMLQSKVGRFLRKYVRKIIPKKT
ncbi:glycosyltransferase family 32 protein [Roseovarius sp. EL26]|uniref:glycosyltransferase family 32 protein n=1 Tax=Roseovarius sp. EL26 TaxID=2126672 RepID=UPI000EA3A428|nr:glycosyltransferase [Roseovarius sp. EL26]